MSEQTRILIVDDDEGVRESLSFILEDEGYAVAGAGKGTAALAHLEDESCQVALVDIRLPDMDGLALLEALKKRDPAMVVVIISAYATLENAVQSLNHGADAYIVKPFHPDEAKVVIRKAIEKQRLVAENLRLLEETRRRNRELSTLYTIDRAAAQSLDLAEILNDSVDKVLETLEVEAGGIFLLEPDGETMTLRVHRGLSDEFVRAVQHIRLGEGISGRAAAEGKPVVLDVPDYPTERLAPHVVREGFQTLASTPLFSTGELVGALNLATRRPRAFPPEEIDLLTAIGRQLGGAVQNARLYEETRQRLEELTSLQEAAMTVAGELELPRVLDRIVEKAATTLGLPFSAIFLLNGDGHLLHLQTTHGLSERYFREMQPVPLGQGLVGTAAGERRPVVSENIENEFRMQALPHNLQVALEEGIRSVLVVPMLAKGNLVGTLSVYTKTRRNFAPTEVRLLSTFADQAAIAVENAQLFKAESTRAEQMAALVEMNRAITEDVGLKETLDRIINSARKIIPVSECSVSLVDELNGDMVVQASTNGEIGVRISAAVPSAVGWVAKTKQLLAEEDVSTNLIFNQELNQRYGIQSAMAVPIVYKGKGIGALGLSVCHARRAFSDGEKMMAQAIADQAAIAIENARLYEETRARAERLSVLNRIARALSTTLNLDELLEIVHREITAVMEAEAFFVALYDRAANELDYRIRVDKGVREPPERRPLLPNLTASVITGKQPRLVRDCEKEVGPPPPETLWGSMQAAQSWLGVPMLLGDSLVGVISVQAYHRNAYGAAEQELLSTIADAVAVAIENARLYSAEQRHAARLDALQRLSIELAALREESAVLNTLVSRAAVLAASPACTVMLVDQATNEAVLAAQTGLPEGTPLGLRVPLTLPILHHSLETGEPIILSDINHDASAMRAILVRPDIRAFFAYPIVREGRVLGFITLSSLTPRTPSTQEITAYRLLAERAAAALENARLYQRLDESKAALEARVHDLERFTKHAVGRELRMKELKDRLRELEKARGEDASAEGRDTSQ